MPEVAVADTSCLQYCYQIGQLDLLRQLYSSVLIPQAVIAELDRGHSAGLNWCQPVDVSVPAHISELRLGLGEKAVLALALERDCRALLDDHAARQTAKSLGIEFTGILGILLRAKNEGRIPEVTSAVELLLAAGFRLNPRTKLDYLALAHE